MLFSRRGMHVAARDAVRMRGKRVHVATLALSACQSVPSDETSEFVSISAITKRRTIPNVTTKSTIDPRLLLTSDGSQLKCRVEFRSV